MNAVRNQSTPMDDEPGAAELEAEFEDWLVWMSDTGRWWAARKATLTAAESSAGCAQYLEADSRGDLRDQIAAEEALSARVASMPQSVERWHRRDSHDG
jgi:hypothetical protein